MVEAIADISNGATSDQTAHAALTFRGYCSACGTWDDHGLQCMCCGYAFDIGSQADHDQPD